MATLIHLIGRLLHAAATLTLMCLVAFPIYWMIVVAVTPLGFSRQISSIVPDSATLANFRAIFVERPMATWLVNSALVAGISSAVAVGIGASCGYGLSRADFRGKNVILGLVLASQMVPTTSILVPLYALFRDLGLLNTLSGVTLGHVSLTLPLAIWMTKGLFDALPRDLEYSAQIDGCTRFSAFTHIALPLAAPGLAATFVYGFVTSWHDFLFPRYFVSSENKWTAAAGLTSFRGEFFTLFEPLMAAAVIFSVPVMIIFFVAQRSIVSGNVAGAVK